MSPMRYVKQQVSFCLAFLLQPISRSINDFVSVGAMAALPPQDDLTTAELIAEIETLIASSRGQSIFTPRIETLYHNATKSARGKFFVLMASLGLLVYNLFLGANFLIIPDEIPLMAMLQLGIATPVISVLIFGVAREMLDSSIPSLIGLLMILATSLIAIALSHNEHAAIYAFVLPLIIIGGNVLVAVSFKMAVLFTVCANMAIAPVLLLHPVIGINVAIFLLAVITTASTYSLVGNYRIDIGLRSAYLHALIEHLRAQQLSLANTQLVSLVNIDGLTGLTNRRGFDTEMANLWSGTDISCDIALLMIDIDHFKALNDTYGHAGGDACLRQVAQLLLKAQQNPRVLAARYGGEEFALVIKESSLDEGYGIAERMRRTIEQHGMVLEDGKPDVHLTVSIGCASIAPSTQSSQADLCRAADAALYKAKQSGRNRTCLAFLDRAGHAEKVRRDGGNKRRE